MTLVGLLAVGLLGLMTPTARADTKAGPDLQLRRVDSTNPAAVSVAFEYDGGSSAVAGLKLGENGRPIQAKAGSLADAKLTNAIVFVVDSSASTDQSAVLAEAKKAVSAIVSAVPGAQFALVTAGKDVATLVRLTTDPAAIKKGLDLLTPGGDGGLWEGVVRGASQFKDLTNVIPNIVLITDGNNGPGTPFSSAVGAVNDAGAVLQALAVKDDKGGLDANVRSLAEGSGGMYQEATKASDESAMAGNLKARLAGQYALTYKTASPTGVNDLTLDISGARVLGSYVAGASIVGAKALAYQKPASGSGISLLQNSLGRLLAIVMGLIAASLAAYALISSVVREDELSSVLSPYAAYRPGGTEEQESPSGMAQTPLMQRAVELTERIAERQGLLKRVEDALERANMPLRAAEAILFYFLASLILALAIVAISRNILIGAIAFPVALLSAPGVLNILAGRRKRKFEGQLPDTLQLLSGTLRAGYSMMQGVEAVSQEVAEPMGRELRRVVTEARLGRPLEESLDAVAERMDSSDFGWATMAIRIQREVGGNLAELLMTVAETMTQRERLRRDVQTLTAEGRVSAYLLGGLPIGLGIVMYVLNPDYMTKLFDSGLGIGMLIAAGVAMAAGFLWMRAIINIDI